MTGRSQLVLCIAACFVCQTITGQTGVLELTLKEAVERAQQYSSDAQAAKHIFRSEYWNYQYYRANYLPSLELASTPYIDRAINKITLADGTVKFVEQNMFNTDLSLTLNQNIPLTGGSFFLQTTAQRMDMLSSKTTAWQTSPVIIGYRQSLFGYNSLKWEKRIEPVRYCEAQKRYIETLELTASRTTDRFFALATAQSNYETALFNYAHADTLYRYAQGRYDIGTITENEMLQLELNKLTEETNCMNARIETENCMQELRSYLGMLEDMELKVNINGNLPDFTVDLESALLIATTNSPGIQRMIRLRLESESAVERAKAETGLKTEMFLRFGLTQTAGSLKEAYRDPPNQQYVSLSLSFPILDWGRGKGRIRLARSQRDLAYAQTEQNRMDFDLNVRKLVKQFNLQTQRVQVAARTDETAKRRHEVARRLYMLGKLTILDLNVSISEKDAAKRNYVNALYTYWGLYYALRSLALYDFERNEELKIPDDKLKNGG